MNLQFTLKNVEAKIENTNEETNLYIKGEGKPYKLNNEGMVEIYKVNLNDVIFETVDKDGQREGYVKFKVDPNNEGQLFTIVFNQE